MKIYENEVSSESILSKVQGLSLTKIVKNRDEYINYVLLLLLHFDKFSRTISKHEPWLDPDRRVTHFVTIWYHISELSYKNLWLHLQLAMEVKPLLLLQ